MAFMVELPARSVSPRSGEPSPTGCWGTIVYAVKWLWNHWLVVTLAWFACATFTAAEIKRSKNREMLSCFANLVIGWPLLLPFALLEGKDGWRRLRTHWRKVLLIAVLAGLEKNLTNSTLSSLGGALKEALHGLNVVFTFFVAAVAGADDRAYYCIRGCRCRGNGLLAMGLVLVAGGSVFALPKTHREHENVWESSTLGVVLQLGAGLAYSMKFTALKLLLCNDQMTLNVAQQAPSKAQVVLWVNPVIGLMSLALVPLKNDWTLPPLGDAFAVAVSAALILVCQMQLIQLLKSPVTVAVLAVFHDLTIILYFVYMAPERESLSEAQGVGYTVSAFGAVLYACSKRNSDRAQQDLDDGNNSSVENYARTQQAESLNLSFSSEASSFR